MDNLEQLHLIARWLKTLEDLANEDSDALELKSQVELNKIWDDIHKRNKGKKPRW